MDHTIGPDRVLCSLAVSTNEIMGIHLVSKRVIESSMNRAEGGLM